MHSRDGDVPERFLDIGRTGPPREAGSELGQVTL